MTVKEYMLENWADFRGKNWSIVWRQLPEELKSPEKSIESYRELFEWYSELPEEEKFGHGRRVEDYPYDESVFEEK